MEYLHPTFELITSKDNLEKICLEYGFPVMLKACENLYDGRGNYLIKERIRLQQSFHIFQVNNAWLRNLSTIKKKSQL